MLDITCRLCSSSCSLISLFNGKCRENRDYIRKLVEITTGIKFEKDDTFKWICYSCTVEVYNFYVFKIRSLENEKLLEGQKKKGEKLKSNKIEILDLDSIDLPDIKEVLDNLGPWLLSKGNQCQPVNGNFDEHKTVSDNVDCNKGSSEILRTVENSTQYDTIGTSDTSTQCDLPKNTSHKGIQSNLPKPSFNKYTQYTISNTEIYTQTNTLTKSSKVQCSLMTGPVAVKTTKKDCDTQTKPTMLDQSTQHCDNCKGNCNKMDCKCYVPKSVNIKEEHHSLSPIALSPMNSLNLSITSTDTSIPNLSSPVSANLLTVRSRGRRVIICMECDQSVYSKASYKLHMKSHLVCSFCKKKFRSLKRVKLHIEEDCKVKKMIKTEAVVRLVRLERLKNIMERHPRCLEDFSRRKDKTVRMRSRSTSSVDSLYSSSCSCCCSCRSSIAILHGLTMGMDKSVQTNLWVDNPIVFGVGCKDNLPRMVLKSELDDSGAGLSPAKKIKLSHSLVKRN